MSEAPKIYTAIADILAESGAIGKDSKNQTQGFMYRGIDAVMNVFHPLLAKHRVFAVPVVMETEREERQTARGGNLIYTLMKVKYIFYADDGSSIEAVVHGEGMDSADKSANKAMSVAYKYALFQLFCIPTEEMKDPDADSPEPSVKAPQTNPVNPVKPLKNSAINELIAMAGNKKPVETDADLPYTVYCCADCGKPFEPFTSKNGDTWTSEQVFAMAVKKNTDGKARCKPCREKLEGVPR